MTRIAAIRGWDLHLGFRDGPYAMSHVVQEFIASTVVELAAEDGVTGVGETVPAPSLSPDERVRNEAAFVAELGALVGQPLDAARRLRPGWRRAARAGAGLPSGSRPRCLISRRAGLASHSGRNCRAHNRVTARKIAPCGLFLNLRAHA